MVAGVGLKLATGDFSLFLFWEGFGVTLDGAQDLLLAGFGGDNLGCRGLNLALLRAGASALLAELCLWPLRTFLPGPERRGDRRCGMV